MFKSTKFVLMSFVFTLLFSPSLILAQTADVDNSENVSSCVTINNNLSYKNRKINNKDDVISLQDFLNTKGYLSDTSVTGYFGPLTTSAVIAFQKDNGLVSTPPGYVGAGTRGVMNNLICNQPEVSEGSTSGGITVSGNIGGTLARTISTDPCSNGELFNFVNGERCVTPDTGTIFPLGCTSAVGFSPVTGASCATGDAPGIQSPNQLCSDGRIISVMLKCDVANPESVVPTVEFLDRPTLNLQLDQNNKEASLYGKVYIRVTAGGTPVDVGGLGSILRLYNDNAMAMSSNGTNYRIIYSSIGETTLVSANTSATFAVAVSAPTRELVPGIYTVASLIGSVGPVYGVTQSAPIYIMGEVSRKVVNVQPSYPPVTVLGETSPYISGVRVLENGNIRIHGYNFDKISNKVTINNITKIISSETPLPQVGGRQRLALVPVSPSDFGITTNGFYTILITNSNGASNNFGFDVRLTGAVSPVVSYITPIYGTASTSITIYGSGFTPSSIVLVGDNVSSVNPTSVSADGTKIIFNFPADALTKFSSNLFSVKVSNSGNVSNYVLFSIGSVQSSTLANPTLSSVSPASQFVVGGTTMNIATFKLATKQSGPSANIRELRFSITGADAIMSVNVGGIVAPVVNNRVTVTGLNLPISSVGTEVPVTVKFSGFQNSNTGGSLQNGIPNVGITLDYVEATTGAGQIVTNTAPISSNKMTLVASKPTVTMSAGGTNSLVLGAENKIAEFTVTADTNGKINLGNVGIDINTSGIQNLSIEKQIRLTSGGNVISVLTTGNDGASYSYRSMLFNTPYEISAGQSVTFSVYATINGTAQSGGTSAVYSVLNRANFFWSDVIGGNVKYTGSSSIYNFPTNSYVTSGSAITVAPNSSAKIYIDGFSNLRDINVYVGQSHSKVWVGTGGASYSSSYVITQAPGGFNCTSIGSSPTWNANTESGKIDAVVQAVYAGCKVAITYKALNAQGQVVASDTLNMTVLPSHTTTQRTPIVSISQNPTTPTEVSVPVTISWTSSGVKLCTVVKAVRPTGATAYEAPGYAFGWTSNETAPNVANSAVATPGKAGDHKFIISCIGNDNQIYTKEVIHAVIEGSINGAIGSVPLNGACQSSYSCAGNFVCSSGVCTTPSISSAKIYIDGFSNLRDINVYVGQPHSKVWLGVGGASYSSSYVITQAPGGVTCSSTGSSSTWNANTASGKIDAVVQAIYAGCKVAITYKVLNAQGQVMASDTLNMTVLPAPVAATPEVQCTRQALICSDGSVATRNPATCVDTCTTPVVLTSNNLSATLTANGSTSPITVNVGDTLVWKWDSTGGTGWSGSQTNSGCLNTITNGTIPFVNTERGVSSPIIPASYAGCTVVATYTVTGAGGTKSVSAKVNINSQAYTIAPLISSSPRVLGAFTSSISCVDLPYNMHRGAESTYVTKLQNFLVQKGFLVGETSGLYLDKTMEAVKDYQASKGLPITGMVYDFTRQMIKNDTCQ